MSAPLPIVQKLAEFVRPTALDIPAKVESFNHEGATLFAVSWGNLDQDDLLVRVHSPCLFGEAFGVNSCDCGQQLRDSMMRGKEAGEGCHVKCVQF